MTRRVKDHPFRQEADLLRAALRDDLRRDREGLGSINPVVRRYMREYGDMDQAHRQMRSDAARLGYLAAYDEEWLEGRV